MKIFNAVFQKFYRAKFSAAGLFYKHLLMPEMVRFMMKSTGGFVWCCKNYDGDVQTALVSQGFGSPSLSTSCLVTNDGALVAGCKTASPAGQVTAWSRVLKHRARIDGNRELERFSGALERAAVSVIESGMMTADISHE